MKLWLVEINYDDFEYDYFVDGVVWAETPESAEQFIREGSPPASRRWHTSDRQGSSD